MTLAPCRRSRVAKDRARRATLTAFNTIEQLQLVAGNNLPAAATAHLTADEADDLATRAAALFGDETARLTAHYRLANDIDARATRIWNGDEGFAPIGSGAPFSGNFDGDGKTIRGLYINRGSNIGLFAAAERANFVSVVLDEAEISGTATVGVLIGESGGSTVSAVSVRATVAATGAGAGGLIGVMVEVSGESGGRVTDSSFTGAVSSSVYTGGLVGEIAERGGTVSNSWSAGEIRGVSDVGGLVGRLRDSVHSSRSSADVHASGDIDSDAFVGGLVGSMESNARITDSNASGRVFSEGNNAGGLVGLMETDTRIDRSWSAGAISSSGDYTGGLVGSAGERATVSQSWSSGVLQSTRSEVGGFVGRLSAPNALFDNNWSLTSNHPRESDRRFCERCLGQRDRIEFMGGRRL